MKIWDRFCRTKFVESIINGLGGVSGEVFNKTQYEVEALTLDNKYLRKDIDGLARENAELWCENSKQIEEINKLQRYLKVANMSERTITTINYTLIRNEFIAEDRMKFFATNGLCEKIKHSDVIRYDFDDGICSASLEVIV